MVGMEDACGKVMENKENLVGEINYAAMPEIGKRFMKKTGFRKFQNPHYRQHFL